MSIQVATLFDTDKKENWRPDGHETRSSSASETKDESQTQPTAKKS